MILFYFNSLAICFSWRSKKNKKLNRL